MIRADKTLLETRQETRVAKPSFHACGRIIRISGILAPERGWLFAREESPVFHSKGWIFKYYIANPFPVHHCILKTGFENNKNNPKCLKRLCSLTRASCKKLLSPKMTCDHLPQASGLYNQQVVAYREL